MCADACVSHGLRVKVSKTGVCFVSCSGSGIRLLCHLGHYSAFDFQHLELGHLVPSEISSAEYELGLEPGK